MRVHGHRRHPGLQVPLRRGEDRQARAAQDRMSVLTAILQALLNGVMTGTLIAIPAIGFTAIFAVLRYPSFAVAAYTTIGAFAGWYANVRFGIGVLPGLVIAAGGAGAIGWLAGDSTL